MRLIWIIIALSAASLGFFWLTEVPLGVPTDDFGTWNRHRYPAGESIPLLINVVVASIAAGVYCAVAWIGQRRIDGADRTGRVVRLAVLVVAGFFWLSAVQRCAPVTYGLIKPNWVLYDKGSAGYFLDSVASEESVSEFLAGYEAELAKGDVLHIGTHPPGLFLLNRGLLLLCETSSGFSSAVLATQPTDMDESFRMLESEARLAPELVAHQRAALWLSVLLTQLAAAAAVVGVYWLVRSAEVVRVDSTMSAADAGVVTENENSPSIAWMVAALWPLVPSLAMFLPKSDALFPLCFNIVIPVWLMALHRRSVVLACLAGLLVWLNAMLSLAVLPVVVVTGMATLMLCRFRLKELLQQYGLRCVLPVLVTFVACCVAFWAVTEVNLANVWAMNLKNHAGFYDQFHRTRWKWMLINPLELTLSVGVPVMGLALAGIYRSRSRIIGSWRRGSLGPVLFQAAIFTWMLLWLSGKNNGEAARLWLFLMPWVIWVASGALRKDTVREWKWLMVVQAVVAIGTVSRVAGFHF